MSGVQKFTTTMRKCSWYSSSINATTHFHFADEKACMTRSFESLRNRNLLQTSGLRFRFRCKTAASRSEPRRPEDRQAKRPTTEDTEKHKGKEELDEYFSVFLRVLGGNSLHQ